MKLDLTIKPFSFRLAQRLKTSQGILKGKNGWLLRLKDSNGHYGWGEVSPIDSKEKNLCSAILEKINTKLSLQELEERLPKWPGALGFGIGAALAELEGIIGFNSKREWLSAPRSAILLANNPSIMKTIDLLVKNQKMTGHPLTLKLKIAIDSQINEAKLLTRLLEKLPENVLLRLDANSGLNQEQAEQWIQYFTKESRLEWLEQPLSTNDLNGHLELSQKVPIALDESLLEKPWLRKSWKGWQIRRPLLEGDPRPLLKELEQGVSYRMISTSFETGIGLRWIHHLAALQQQGPTPTAPGLAPGWCLDGALFSNDPELVWEAA